jgi:hypothetical protein
MTGLYPESHGVVGNTVYDPVYDEKLRLAGVQDVKWGKASEPIYFTARKQGLRTGSSFWVANDVYPRTPDIFLTYKPGDFYNVYDRADEVIKIAFLISSRADLFFISRRSYIRWSACSDRR